MNGPYLFKIPVIQGCSVFKSVKIGPVVLDMILNQFRQCIFAIWLLSPLWIGRGPSFKIMNSLQPMRCCAKFGWNWPRGYWEDFLKFRQCIFAIWSLSPLERGHGTSFKHTIWSISTKLDTKHPWAKGIQVKKIRNTKFSKSILFLY